MKERPVVKGRVFPVVFMLVITLVFISVTSVIYTVTKDTIQLNERLLLKRAVLYSAGLTVPDDPKEAEALYDMRVEEIYGEDAEILYYKIQSLDSATVESYVISRTGPGLWGEITATIGFDQEVHSFLGIEIIDQNETPGLGGRIGEPWFKEQFKGKIPPLSTVPEGNKTRENEFQAITGASYSTEAIQDIMNGAIVYAQETIPR
jgi:Na+-transporting NADH:ubiquinone oxidoreductase subunit C